MDSAMPLVNSFGYKPLKGRQNKCNARLHVYQALKFNNLCSV